jgi:hypothetical protein
MDHSTNTYIKIENLIRRIHTKGEVDKETVLGSNEKIWSREGQEFPRLDLPRTTRLRFSGLRIHDPQVTGP